MYQSFFGLQQEPFSIAPDPRFLYMSDKHREALALLNYGLSRGASFVLLTGEIGAGKTTVWRRFLEELPSNFDVASVVNPKLDAQALIARICEDLHLDPTADAAPLDMIDALHSHLLLAHAMGRRTLIVIDEAQALSSEVLEQLRLLTNLDSSGRKLQVMLIGQPELRQMLEMPQLEPLAQRVVARYHLPALSESETAGYIAHRLAVAGLRGALPFDGESLGLIHRLCRGVPRRINVVCDRALADAQAMGRRRVDRHAVERAVAGVYGARSAPAVKPARERRAIPARAAAGMAVAALAAGVLMAPRIETWWKAVAIAPAPAATPMAASFAPEPLPNASAPAGLAPIPAVATAAPGLAPIPAVATAAPAPAGVAAAALVTAPGKAPQATAPMSSAFATSTAVSAPRPAWDDTIFTTAAADEAAALRALAKLWRTTLATGEPCAAALAQSLRCLRTRGGLATIRQLDRPGLLRLVDERGRVAHALVTGVVGDRAVLSIGGTEHSVAASDLARVWRGEITTFWRAPAAIRDGDLADGTTAGRAWVAERLAALEGAPVAPGKDALRARIAAFQLAHGLTPDGMAGPLTVMQLARASQDDEPRLAR